MVAWGLERRGSGACSLPVWECFIRSDGKVNVSVEISQGKGNGVMVAGACCLVVDNDSSCYRALGIEIKLPFRYN